MQYTEAFISAVKAIWAHKMRSFLTMLGIIIGIFSVTALISVAQGTTASVTSSIESMGSNLLTINIMDRRTALDAGDIEAISKLEGVGMVSPYVQSTYTLRSTIGTMDDVSTYGVSADYTKIVEYTLATGRELTDEDSDKRMRVAVLGSDVATELYNTAEAAIGQEISIGGTRFTVVGVLESEGTSSTGSEDEKVLIPFSTAQRMMKNTDISSIYASATSSDTVELAQTNIEEYLYTLSGSEDNYRVFNQSEVLESLEGVTGTLTMMLGGIAAISLLVGGIGIMNIMLVSVTERTREIGIQKAIGATRKDILTQFLIEAILVSGLGGLLGLGLAYISTGPLGSVLDMTVEIESWVVIVSIVFSLAVGIVFGIYPAIRASKLNPIDALRYE
jgi:putative ABC transport system permease protein